MRMNTATSRSVFTHEGARAKRITPMQQLRRSICSCFLWEKEFYEDGKTIADRIKQTAQHVSLEELAALAVEVRSEHRLRHAPMVLLSVLAQRAVKEDAPAGLVAKTIADTLSRADELGEFLAVHAHLNGANADSVKTTLSAQVKKGVGKAMLKFDAYQLGKYNRKSAVSLRDVIMLCHPKPETEVQSALFKDILEGTLASPDTWEVNLSAGADKRETFERLLREEKLGYMALLRNLRNMDQAGVPADLVKDAILARRGAHNVLPFRFVAASRAAPRFEPYLDEALSESLLEAPAFDGETVILVDVSDSMNARLSQKSDLTRMDAAATLASIFPGSRRVFSFSDRVVEVPARNGMAGVDAIIRSQTHWGTWLGKAVKEVSRKPHTRIIVITDEQSHDRVPDPEVKNAYMINVASKRNGVGYGSWRHIDGFSENTLKWIREIEAMEG